MENHKKPAPNFKHQPTCVKRRPSASDIKNELRQEFRERLKISRRNSQDISRASLMQTAIAEGKEEVRNRLLEDRTLDVDEALALLDEISKEFTDMVDEELTAFYETEEDINNILDKCNVLCKICNDFIEQNSENQGKLVCDNCSSAYFQDE